MIVSRLLQQARSALANNPEGQREAEILLCHSLGVSRSWIYAHADEEVSANRCADYQLLVERRQHGEPVAYITGKREFWSLTLKVTAAVLIPRAETELLVEKVLEHIPRHQGWRVADLGTGSGAIALAIAKERPSCEVHASDISSEALDIAQENAQTLGLDRIRFHQGNWLDPLQGSFQCIVSNPPYVGKTDPHMRRGDCRFEPESALSPGHDPLESIRHIAESALPRLTPGGFLAFEHGYEQGADSRNLLLQSGYLHVQTHRDLAGLERVTLGSKPTDL